jgi:hypothetical protein
LGWGITAVALMAGVMFTALPSAMAQSEEESSILFAPDDEPTGDSSSAADKQMGPPNPYARKVNGKDEVGPPVPYSLRYSLSAQQRPHERAKPGARVFGRYRVRVGAANPTFTDNLKFYKDLYGSPSVYPVFAADWFAWDWYVTFGISLRTGVYTAEGKAAKTATNTADSTTDSLAKDETSSTTLTLIPGQLALAAEFTPLPWKWVVFDGWYGVERLYFQETRAGATAKTSLLRPLATSATSESLTNNGFKTGIVYGGALNIKLNALDEQSIQSMRGSMGLASIYLSPYIEFVKQTSDGVDFSRTNRGITFTFETVY